MKIIIFLIVFLALYFFMPTVSAQTETCDGLNSLLKGACSGLSLEAFLESHPAVQNNGSRAGFPVDPKARNAVLEEQYDRGPVWGLWVHANYVFYEGKLWELMVLWRDEINKTNASKAEFIEACIRKHGIDFRREAMKMNPYTNKECWAPVLVWKTKESIFLAICFSAQDDKKGLCGLFCYDMYPSKTDSQESDPESLLEAKTLSDVQFTQLYKDIEPILEKAIKKYEKQKKKK
jgi:hypothetical protein